MTQPKGNRQCVLCGKLAYLTRDHVPPRQMFPAGTQLITVPVCLECNNAWSGDDEYFRAVVALRAEVQNNPVVNDLLPQIMRGVLRTGPRGNTGTIVSTMRDAELFTPSGVFAGYGGTYMPEDLRMSRFAARIVRGLYFHESTRRLPDTYGVAVYVVANFDPRNTTWREGVQKLIRFALEGKTVDVHPQVFTYAYNLVPDKADATVWILTFYGHTPILCFTVDRADHKAPRPLF